MKVVINACFGGFGISAKAMKRLIAEGCKVVVAEPLSEKSIAEDRNMMTDAGDGYLRSWAGSLIKDGTVYCVPSWQDDHVVRTDPTLIRVVEELGDEANGDHAELRVVEVPDDVAWLIDGYDGNEHVAEVHRTWG